MAIRALTGIAVIMAFLAGAVVAQEAPKLTGTFGEIQTVLAFKVSEAALKNFLPEGWQAAPIGAGPSKDANLRVVFIDEQVAQSADGKAEEVVRRAVLSVPAKNTATGKPTAMNIGGLTSHPKGAPGPYGHYALAASNVERSSRSDASGKTTVEETWEFTAAGGEVIELRLQFARGIATKGKADHCWARECAPGEEKSGRL